MIVSTITRAIWRILAWTSFCFNTCRRLKNLELHESQCGAREVGATVEERARSMDDEEDAQPPAKRRQGWDSGGAIGGTATPHLQQSDL